MDDKLSPPFSAAIDGVYNDKYQPTMDDRLSPPFTGVPDGVYNEKFQQAMEVALQTLLSPQGFLSFERFGKREN